MFPILCWVATTMMRVERRKGLGVGAATLTLLTFVVSCGGGGHDITAPTPVATQIVVSPSATTIIAGQQATFTAVAKDASGNAVNESLTWTSSDPTVASVASGTVQGLKAGTTTIRATDGTINGDATLTVLVPVSDVVVTPSPTIVLINQTAQLTAALHDAAGATITGRTVTWSSSNDAIASVSATGLVTGKTAGTVTISAVAEGKTGSSTVTVRSPVASVTVSPTTLALGSGKSSTLTATVKDASGTILTDRTVTWSSSDPSKATVGSATGVVTAVSAGTTTVTATSEGQTGQSTITVTDLTPPSVASLSASPASINVSSGAQVVTFSANVLDAGGSGVSRVDFALNAPQGTANNPVYACSAMSLSSGTSSNGVWTCPMTIPAGSAPGTWTVSVVAIDAVLNRRSLSSANLASSGLQSTIAVANSNPDNTPPAPVGGLNGIPPQVDVTTQPATMTVSVRLTDAGAGVAHFDLALVAPDGKTSVGCSAAAPITGTTADGTWQCAVTIPQGAQAGNWSILIRAIDAVFNTYQSAASSTLTVVDNAPDTTPPTFVGLTVSPTTVDVSTGAQTVTATAHLTDTGTGVSSFVFRVAAPDSTIARCLADHPTAGTPSDGTWTCQITIPPGGAAGDWAITVQASDAALNTATLGTAALSAANFPTKITVISP
ncbi:MAG TPA: Ig-like domain-containing protein [Gemmatimonadaceae bacterium]